MRSAATKKPATSEKVELGARDGGGEVRHAVVTFTPTMLETLAAAGYEPVVYDAMVVAAAVEFGDRSVLRPPLGWSRGLRLRVPVREPSRWGSPAVVEALDRALSFLTGDRWSFEFVAASTPEMADRQELLPFPSRARSVLLFSDGLDSRAVAALREREDPGSMVRVRVGRGRSDVSPCDRVPFAGLPFEVGFPRVNMEKSARGRGFKFALVGAIAAHLTGAEEVVLPESGQGVFGPVLVRVGHAPPDHRNHPFFTERMERLTQALLGRRVRYAFPRIWATKGETIRQYVALDRAADWQLTRSCWRDARWTSVGGRHRQCGICAACMLRRVSVHAAGLCEPVDTYVCTDLDAPAFEGSLDADFKRLTAALAQYAKAGVLHMDHLADLARSKARPTVRRHALLLARTLAMGVSDAERSLADTLERHAAEWHAFLRERAQESFVRTLARQCP